MNTFGTRYRTTIFGTSHGPFVGCTIEGLPSGTRVDDAFVQSQLDRRRPGQSLLVSQRKEEDRVELSGGLRDGFATGEPIVGIIRNEDVRSESYEKVGRVPRPGHGDFAAIMKYGGAKLAQERNELMLEAMGHQGLGWEGEGFDERELTQTRDWLRSRGNTIEGGTSEVQLNIIAKHVLALPD